MSIHDTQPAPPTTNGPSAGRPPALLTRPVMDRGSALWRFHTALDDLVVLTAVPAATAVPEPADVADVLTALAAGIGQLDPVLEQLADRLTALADSPNADTATKQAPVDGQLVDGQLADVADVAGVLTAALTALATARCGLTSTAAATAVAGGHARQLVLVDPAHQAGPAGPESA